MVLFFVSLDNLEAKQSICLIKSIFNTECYGCGITKAVIAAIQLDLPRAYHYNKLIVIVAPLMTYLWGKKLYITGKQLYQKPSLSHRQNHQKR